MHLALIGFRCCGKTTVGRILAGRLGLEFIDTDRLVESMSGFVIRRIVELEGWRGFRSIEARALQAALDRGPAVIATGGGIVLRRENIERMKKRATVFWLRAPAGVIQCRMMLEDGTESRPGLTMADPVDEAPALIQEREPMYRKAADHVVDSGVNDPECVAEAICGMLPEFPTVIEEGA